MKITYIHHSSFLVELTSGSLLFDYTKGKLPELEQDKPLLVFASHRHLDHYSNKISELKNQYKNTRFILSDDIWKQKKDIPDSVVTVMKPGQTHTESFVSENGFNVEITTYQSTDEGVAFLVKAEGKTIYHAGDLNNWRWEGEPDDWNERMAENYSNEVDKMTGQSIDVAFLPLDPRQENGFYLGFDEFMRKIKVSRAFPMHCWGDFSVIQRLKGMETSAPYRDKIIEIHKDEENFLIN